MNADAASNLRAILPREGATRCGLSFYLNSSNAPLFTIKPDGTIEFGPAFTTQDEASKLFWDSLAKHFPHWRAPAGSA